VQALKERTTEGALLVEEVVEGLACMVDTMVPHSMSKDLRKAMQLSMVDTTGKMLTTKIAHMVVSSRLSHMEFQQVEVSHIFRIKADVKVCLNAIFRSIHKGVLASFVSFREPTKRPQLKPSYVARLRLF
jgi:hypothetical protein